MLDRYAMYEETNLGTDFKPALSCYVAKYIEHALF